MTLPLPHIKFLFWWIVRFFIFLEFLRNVPKYMFKKSNYHFERMLHFICQESLRDLICDYGALRLSFFRWRNSCFFFFTRKTAPGNVLILTVDTCTVQLFISFWHFLWTISKIIFTFLNINFITNSWDTFLPKSYYSVLQLIHRSNRSVFCIPDMVKVSLGYFRSELYRSNKDFQKNM